MNDLIMNMYRGFLFPLLSVFSFMLCAYALGRVLSDRVFKIQWRHEYFKSIPCIVLGIDMLGLLFITLGYFAGFRGIVYAAIIIPGSILGIYFIALEFKRRRNFSWKKEHLFAAALIPVLIFFLSSSLCLPVNWDELTYHITVPVRWIADGYPYVYRDIPYSGYPCLSEIIYTNLILAGGVTTPRILNYGVNVLIFWCLYVLLRPGLPFRKTIALLFAFIISPITSMMVKEAYVEPLILLNLAGALFFHRGIMRDENKQGLMLLVMPAVFAGAAVSVKLTGVSIALVIFIIILGVNIRHRKALNLGVFMGISILFALVFYLRTWTGTGNPFYPFFSGLFTSDAGALLMSKYHHDIGSLNFGSKTPLSFILSPILMTFDPAKYDGFFGYQFIPLFLLFVEYSIGVFRKKLLKNSLFIPAVIIYLFWFFTSQQARFLIPLFFITLLASKISLRNLKKTASTAFLTAVLLLSLVSFPLEAVLHYASCWKYALGGVTPVQWVSAGIGGDYLGALEAVKEKTPPEARVLLIFERRGLYMPRAYEIGTPYYQEKYFTPISRSEDDVYRKLRERGIGFLLAGSFEKNPDRLKIYDNEFVRFSALLGRLREKGLLKIIWSARGYSLLEVVQENKE